MLLLLPLLVIGVIWGKKPAIWATFLSVAVLDFFFVKPLYTFSIDDIKYLPVFIVFFAVGVTTSFLSDMLKWRIETYRKQEKFLNRIYQYSRDLLSRNGLQDIIHFIQQELQRLFSGRYRCFTAERGQGSSNSKPAARLSASSARRSSAFPNGSFKTINPPEAAQTRFHHPHGIIFL